MRLALVVHAFPPHAYTGVEVYTESLARALVAAGDEVHVFAACRDAGREHLEQRSEARDGYRVTWLNLALGVDDEDARRMAPGAAAAFGRFLERERPDVVHLQHLVGFGPAVVDEARRRDVPVMFTAQDAFAACEGYALLQPDLTPLAPTNFLQAARCRVARGELDAHLGAHDGWLVPGSSGPEVAAVARTLRGEGEDEAALGDLALRLAGEARERLDALERCDLVEAPTAFLRGVLTDAGLRKPVRVRALGIEADALAAVERPVRPAGEPLRVLYLGGYYEHKGVHVLLEAFDGLADVASLTLRGCAGSSGYSARLASLAAAVDAQLGGPFEREELPGLLEACDVVALPSLWSENAPFVIREAFAAGRPVLASDTPALRESVRDGIDGRLVAQGDPAAWGAALRELAEDPQAHARLTAGVRAPKTIAADAAELRADYARLVEERAVARERRRGRLPEHLRVFAARYEALERLPLDELVGRAARGLAARAQASGVEPPGLTQLGDVAALGAGLRERVAGLVRADAWRAEVAGEREREAQDAAARTREAEAAAASARARAEWEHELLAEREARLAWLEQRLAANEATRTELDGRLELAERTGAELAGQLDEARAALASSQSERDWLTEQAQAARAESAALKDERTSRDAELARRGEELTWRREQLADREAHVADLELRVEVARAADAEARAALDGLHAEATASGGEHARLAAEHADLMRERASAAEHQRYLEGRLAQSSERVRALETELEWRAQEMDAARVEARTLGPLAFGAKLKRRLASWTGLASAAGSTLPSESESESEAQAQAAPQGERSADDGDDATGGATGPEAQDIDGGPR